MPTPRSRVAPAESGLTLIELCIAVALLALIATMSYRGLDSMSRTSEHTLAEGERWQAAALFFERFGADVAQPARRPLRNPDDIASANEATPATPPAALTPQARDAMAAAGMQQPPGVESNALPAWWGRPLPPTDHGGQDTAQNYDCPLEFTRKSMAGRDEIRLGYRLRADHVELLIWSVLDRAPDSKPQIYTLLEGVKDLRFRHLDAAGMWQEAWPVKGNNEPLPRGIELVLTLTDGTVLRRVFSLPS